MKNLRKKFIVISWVLLLFATLLPVSAATNITVTVTYDQTSARESLQYLNAFRTSTTENWQYNESNQKIWLTGLTALKYDYTLEKYAMQRAAEIAVDFSHTRPNGQSSTAEIAEYGYRGENLARGHTTYQAAIDAWKETDKPYSGQGHRQNMQDKNYTCVGVGHIT